MRLAVELTCDMSYGFIFSVSFSVFMRNTQLREPGLLKVFMKDMKRSDVFHKGYMLQQKPKVLTIPDDDE